MKSCHCVITGGAGFIGSHLADQLLALGHSVTVIDNLSWGDEAFLTQHKTNKKFRFVKLDLLDYQELVTMLDPKTHTVFHLAANSDIKKGFADPTIDFTNTTQATFNVLMAMKEKGIKHIFFTSGSGVYGDVGSTYTNENFGPLLPVSIYGATKLSAEAMISAFSYLYDIQAWILRPANIIGPRSTHGVVLDFITKLQQDPTLLTILGNGKQSKSYLYVSDVIAAIMLVWQSSNERINLYNIASDTFVTVTQIAQAVVQMMQLSGTKFHYTGGYGGWKGDVPVVRLNNDAIMALGWQIRYTSKQAVEATIQALLREKGIDYGN